MINGDWDLYIATLLLEVNRHSNPKTPSFRVSEWTEHFAEAGFDGMELWEYHATLVESDEAEALQRAAFPTAIFNTYASMDEAGREARREATRWVERLEPWGVKFNVGKDPEERETYLAGVREWRSALPEDVTLLCECHPGTIIEEPEAAKRFFEDLNVENWGVIVHPLNHLDSLRAWFDTLGSAIMHAHLQMRSEDRGVIRFDRRPEQVREAVRIMSEGGFRGSCSFEFTEGMNAPGENIEDLWTNTLRDLFTFREILAL
jgi:sugar phosphate isomerase/epimerase